MLISHTAALLQGVKALPLLYRCGVDERHGSGVVVGGSKVRTHSGQNSFPVSIRLQRLLGFGPAFSGRAMAG